MSERHLHGCPFCEACCGLAVDVEAGRVSRIRGHADDVFSHGYICPKGASLAQLRDDPDRLRTPLVKRAGAFEAVTWEEALSEVERRLPPLRAEFGPAACALAIGNPTVHKFGLLLYVGALARALASPNVFTTATLDGMPKQLSSALLFGDFTSIPVPDIERCDFLLILGANPLVSNGSFWTVPDYRGKARALRERGGRIVVVDPRRTETAEAADRHVPIRPGGDAFLLAALVNVLFAEGLVRLGRLAPHVTGVEALRTATAHFTPEAVAPRCGVPAEAIRELARELAAAPRAAVYGRMGTCAQAHGTVASWLVDVLNVLTGHLDEPGGAMFPRPAAFATNTRGAPGSGPGATIGRYHSRAARAPEVMGEFPMSCLAEEIDTPGEGRIRALITIAANPVLSAPNGARLARALGLLDLMVSLDLYVTETSRHADVILPGPAPLEEGHYDAFYSLFAHRNFARYSPPVFAPAPGTPPEWQTLLRLAAIAAGDPRRDVARLDDEHFAGALAVSGADAAQARAALAGHSGPERLLDLALRTGPYGDSFGARTGGLALDRLLASPDGVDLGRLEPRVPEVLRTRSGTIELAPELLLRELERIRGGEHTPGLVLVGRRHVRSNNSWLHNLPALAKGPVRCTLLVHPSDATRLGLEAGGRARVAAAGREIEVPIELDDAMLPGVVSLPHGWGHDLPGTRLRVAAERPGANVNLLADESVREPLSGNAIFSGIPVEVRPVLQSSARSGGPREREAV